MIGGPLDANLRGELALEQLRVLKDVTWPAVQSDIEHERVVEMPEVEIVPCDDALAPLGPAYGIRRRDDEPPVPISPGVGAWPGRYRAWVLPQSGVAVAAEPLDDEESYLRAHRRELFAAQHVDDVALVPLTDLRVGNPLEFGIAPLNSLYSLAHWAANRFVRAYYEARFERRSGKLSHEDPFSVVRLRLYRRLVLGTLYRIRPRRPAGQIVEAVVSEIDQNAVGPYR